MKVWLIILLGGALTFLTRFSFIGLFAGRTVPGWANDALRLVPIAALSALIAADLGAPQDSASLIWPRWAAAAVAMALAWKTKNVGWAVFGGMAAFLALRAW